MSLAFPETFPSKDGILWDRKQGVAESRLPLNKESNPASTLENHGLNRLTLIGRSAELLCARRVLLIFSG